MSIEDHLGKEVMMEGIAQNAKGGAVLITKDENVIYIKGLAEWSEDMLGEQLAVRGILKREKYIPDPRVDENGAISQGAVGRQLVLEEAKY